MSHKPGGAKGHKKPHHHRTTKGFHNFLPHPHHGDGGNGVGGIVGKFVHHGHAGHKGHKGHKPKKTGAGPLNMCAFEAAGLITDGPALEAFMDYGAPVDGASIPDAMAYMGVSPVQTWTLSRGTMLALSRPGAGHAVVIDELDDDGVWVWSWGEPHWLTWAHVDAYGEDAWSPPTIR